MCSKWIFILNQVKSYTAQVRSGLDTFLSFMCTVNSTLWERPLQSYFICNLVTISTCETLSDRYKLFPI